MEKEKTLLQNRITLTEEEKKRVLNDSEFKKFLKNSDLVLNEKEKEEETK